MIRINEFESKVKKLELGKAIEKNTFKLTRDYLNGDIIEKNTGYASYTYDDSFIIKNMNEIQNAIKTKPYRKVTKEELNNKVQNIINEYSQYTTYNNLNSRGELDTKQKSFLMEYQNRVFYLILELRVALGLDVSDFYHEEVYDYCEAIITDVMNNKYKRLNIEQHLNSKGNIIRTY